MAAVAEFLKNPVTFMKNNIVAQAVAGTAVAGQTDKFTLVPSAREGFTTDGEKCTVYEMKQASVAGTEKDSFEAYWCPYESEHVHAITLAAEADYMFTAKMDGCSFGVGMPALDKSVRVAHANLQGTDALNLIVQAMANELMKGDRADMKLVARLNMEQLHIKANQQLRQLKSSDGVGQPKLATSLGPLDYRALGLFSTTFGVRSSTGDWSFYFHLYRPKDAAYELIGCFPFPNRA
jgi:hypothetical protein